MACSERAHIGVGYALERHGFLPDMIIGTSVGALTGAGVLLDQGDLESALPAGAAIPGMLPPVRRADRTLVDGRLVAYVPVLPTQQAGAAGLVVATGPESSPLRGTVPRRRAGAIAARAGLLMLHHQIERDLHEVSQYIPTAVLPTGIETWPAPWDFGQSQRLISTACTTAERFLDGLRISGPGLYRVDESSAASAGPDEASISSTAEADL